ncbi:hypothetical protein ACFRNT_38220 [Streptomyces sp. NPDC056697]|uniref:hypothetical protein n=1 Tax=Streptomyces sp. NPDC056697 TaxID=3345915 RepID=UPI00368852AF
MIGLGGAEFRLPLLISRFGFAALSAVILNKAMSLVVVLTALSARLAAMPAADVAARWPVAVSLPVGSLLGAPPPRLQPPDPKAADRSTGCHEMLRPTPLRSFVMRMRNE